MKPVIIKNSKLPEAISWFMDVGGVTLFPFIFIKGEGNDRLIRHETIHIKQYAETLVLGFLLIYLWDFAYGFAKYRNYDDAYRSIRFEREAYANDHDEHYLELREKFAWIKYKV